MRGAPGIPRPLAAAVAAAVLGAGLGAASPGALAAGEVEPLTLSVPPLHFHFSAREMEVARRLAQRAPADLQRVAGALGLPVPEHLDVYVVSRRGSVDPRAWGLPLGPEWAAGLALSSRPVIVLRTIEETGPYGNQAATVLVHELVHATCSQGLGAAYGELPAWFREGVASYLAFEWRLGDSIRSARFALLGEAVPFAELSGSFPADARRAEFAYLQSFAFVAWLVDHHEPDSLARLVRGVAEGESFERSFRETFGGPLSELEGRWRRRFVIVHRWLPLLTSTTTLWLGVSALVVVAWARKRRRAARKVAEWEEWEEDLAEMEAAEGEPEDDAGNEDGEP